MSSQTTHVPVIGGRHQANNNDRASINLSSAQSNTKLSI